MPNKSARTLPDAELRVVTGVSPDPASPAAIRRRFRRFLDDGAELRPAGRAAEDPEVLLTPRYLPRHAVPLFDVTYYLADFRFDDALGFFVGYVARGERSGRRVRHLHPRIFYKDSSLTWRVASHYIHDEDEFWIGKGDVQVEHRGGHVHVTSFEETTNLPFEIQNALDEVSRRTKKRRDDDAIELVLRQAPSGRVEPYSDFTTPRRRAAARGQVNGGRRVARFRRRGDPSSLEFASGYEPDFTRGIVEETRAASKFFGGELRKLRILSKNREIQYLFMASPTHAWVIWPQTLTTELSTYGVRVLDVHADEDLFVPGYEYHEDGHSQIPKGYAGEPHPLDPHRADASAWLEKLPVIREFRRKLRNQVRIHTPRRTAIPR